MMHHTKMSHIPNPVGDREETDSGPRIAIDFSGPRADYPIPRLKPEYASSVPWLLAFRRALETPESNLSPYIEAFEPVGGDGFDTGRS